MGNGGTSGSLGTGKVVNKASLVFNRSDTVTVANTISGSGSLTQAGTGAGRPHGHQQLRGGTTIDAGTRRAATPRQLGTGSVILNGGTAGLQPQRDTLSLANAIAGTGNWSHAGTAPWASPADNTTRAAPPSAPATLRSATAAPAAAWAAAMSSTTARWSSTQQRPVVTVTNAIERHRHADTGRQRHVMLTGDNSYGATTAIGGGTLQFGASGTIGNLARARSPSSTA